MKNEFQKNCKYTAQLALRSEYGFAPALQDITLLEAHGDRTYIHFRVQTNYYTFRSYVCDRQTGSVWVDKGTITRTDDRGFELDA